MRKTLAIVSLCVPLLFALSAKTQASVAFATPGLARDCYLIAEYNLMQGFKEVSPLDVCNAAIEESIKSEERAGTLVNRSVVLVRMNLLGRAVADCRNAIKLAPQMGEGYANLGIAYMKQGNFKDALPPLDKGIELGVNKPHVAYYTRGMVREALKDVKGAYLDYKKSAELMPDYEPANEELKRFTVTYKSAPAATQ